MGLEIWTTLATVGTFFVIGASAIAAFVQLRHLRSNNELQALLAVERDFHSPQLQAAFNFVQVQLPSRMEDGTFRRELAEIGYIDGQRHPEMEVCNWFETVGMLVKAGFVHEEVFFAMFGRLVNHYWDVLHPTIAVLRRKRGAMQYENFEFLAIRAKRWRGRYPNGTYPRRMQRAVVVDAWVTADAEMQVKTISGEAAPDSRRGHADSGPS